MIEDNLYVFKNITIKNYWKQLQVKQHKKESNCNIKLDN